MSEEIVENEGEEVEFIETEEESDVELDETESEEGTEEEGQVDWKTRAEKAEALIVKNKTKKSKAKVTNSSDSTRMDKLELRQEGYPSDIVDSIMELGGKEALKNPVLKKAVDDMLVQHKANIASKVKSSSGSPSLNKYSKQDLDNMSVEELEKVLPHADV